MNQLVFFDEPELEFGLGALAEDPRDGLTLFGPHESFYNRTIQIGVIGTLKGIELYKQFVRQLNRPIFSWKQYPAYLKKASDELSFARPSFPGFEAVFGMKWPIEPTVSIPISDSILEKAIFEQDVHIRTHNVVSLFLDEIIRFHQEEEEKIDVWFIVPTRQLWKQCRPKSKSKETLSSTAREFASGQLVLIPELGDEINDEIEIHDSSSNFHHQLKARAIKEKVNIPLQIILEPTLEFRDKQKNKKYSSDMMAHLAWTQSTTVHYKMSRLPWKLAGVREGVCYLGLVFKRLQRINREGYACSAAQMFLDSGDGVVFKGNLGPWFNEESKEFHLAREDAQELLGLALDSYAQKHKNYPIEMFVHGRARFNDEEWSGFQDAIEEREAETKLVGIAIRESKKLKLFKDVPDQACKYGNLRGLGWIVDNYEGYLWTRGFVPRLNTSISIEIPNPLRILVARGEADMQVIMKDILALTKLNYNACILGDGLPVTLRFSDQIGSILTAVDDIGNKLLPFRYYI